MTSEFLKGTNIPSWLHCSGEVFGQRAQELARRFVELAVAVLAPANPDEAYIRFAGGERLSLELILYPHDEFENESALLRGLADEFAQLSGATSETSPVHEAAPETPCFLTLGDLDDSKQDAGPPPPGAVQIFYCARGLESDGGRALGRDSDVASKVKFVVKRLAETGMYRPLIEPPMVWDAHLRTLAMDFPSFNEVIERIVRPHLALLSKGIDHRMSPALLVGPPGVGKTFFASALAHVMGITSPLFIPMSAETNGATLAGSSSFWSNSAPGSLFELLAWGKEGQDACANPLVVLDELDKISGDHRYSPLGALYSLLERHTASKFQDQALSDITIDASYVRYVATANDIEMIPEALRSRFAVFHIQPPTKAQQVSMARMIFRSVLIALGVQGRLKAEEGIFELAGDDSARSLRMQMEAAVARALVDGRDTVTAEDWQCVRRKPQSRPSIGFCP
jgi:hypothetical protein